MRYLAQATGCSTYRIYKLDNGLIDAGPLSEKEFLDFKAKSPSDKPIIITK